MSKLEWDKSGDRLFETGVDRGVLFLFSAGKYGKGSPWNGLISVNQSSEGGESNKAYADNGVYLNMTSVENANVTIEAYSAPPDFSKCLGKPVIIPGVHVTQQNPKKFGFSYRSIVNNDLLGDEFDYVIHLVYGCLASPSEKNSSTVNDSPEADTMSWDVSTTPIFLDVNRKAAIIDLRKSDFVKEGLANVFRSIEKMLYGSDDTDSKLPLYAELEHEIAEGIYLHDSNGERILDSSGEPIETFAIA